MTLLEREADGQEQKLDEIMSKLFEPWRLGSRESRTMMLRILGRVRGLVATCRLRRIASPYPIWRSPVDRFPGAGSLTLI